MAAKKILFFTAGAIPTTDEAAAIAKLNKLASSAYEVGVRRGDVAANFSYGAGPEATDYVSFVSPMTKPSAYSAKTTFNPDAPLPGGNLTSTQAIIASGQKVACGTVSGSGTFATPTIVNGVITGIVLSSS